MTGTTTELNLKTAQDSDDNADYLTISLSQSLQTVDALFNNVTGHNHNGAHQGGPVAGTSMPNGSITNAKLASDTARANLLTNGGFEIWQRGNGPFSGSAVWTADRWQTVLVGSDTLSVAKGTGGTADGAFGSQACASCVFTLSGGAGGSALYQTLKPSDGNQLVGRTVSASMRVYSTVANAVRIGIYNGSAYTYSNYHTGSSTYETLTVTAAVSASATQVFVSALFSASSQFYLDNAMLVVGSQYADYAPLHPADDLARCLRYYEQIGDISGYPLVYMGQGNAGQPCGSSLAFKAVKAITPTATKNGTWYVANCGQPITAGVGTHGCQMSTTATAAGQVQCQANGVGQNFVFEANP